MRWSYAPFGCAGPLKEDLNVALIKAEAAVRRAVKVKYGCHIMVPPAEYEDGVPNSASGAENMVLSVRCTRARMVFLAKNRFFARKWL